MKFSVLTLFPELFEQYLSQTILKRASDKDIINFNIVNIRDYARNKHSQMDDIPFGGGAGMVLKPEAYWNFFYENYEFYNNENSKKPYVIFLSPQGKQLTHNKVTELSEKEEIVLISGRYEGLDQRVIDKFVDEEISIGDYVLSSGDLPSLVIMDSVIRILTHFITDFWDSRSIQDQWKLMAILFQKYCEVAITLKLMNIGSFIQLRKL